MLSKSHLVLLKRLDQSRVLNISEHSDRSFTDMEACFLVEEIPEPISGADKHRLCIGGKEISSTLLNA